MGGRQALRLPDPADAGRVIARRQHPGSGVHHRPLIRCRRADLQEQSAVTHLIRAPGRDGEGLATLPHRIPGGAPRSRAAPARSMKAAHVYSSIRGRLSARRSPVRSCRRGVANLRGGRRGRSRTAPTLRRGLIRVLGPSPAFEISGSHDCPRDSGPPGRAMRRHCKKPCLSWERLFARHR